MFSGVLTARDPYLREGDLVVVNLRPPPEMAASCKQGTVKRPPIPQIKPVFGYICQSQRYGNRHNEQLHAIVGQSLYLLSSRKISFLLFYFVFFLYLFHSTAMIVVLIYWLLNLASKLLTY